MKGVLFLERRELVSATSLQVRGGAVIGTCEIQGKHSLNPTVAAWWWRISVWATASVGLGPVVMRPLRTGLLPWASSLRLRSTCHGGVEAERLGEGARYQLPSRVANVP